MVTISPPGPIEDTTVGDPQILTCMATTTTMVRSDLLTFMWIKQGDVITNSSDGRVTIQSATPMNNMYMNVLQFENLIESDGGIYTCNVTFFNVNGSSSVEVEPPDCEYNYYRDSSYILSLTQILKIKIYIVVNYAYHTWENFGRANLVNCEPFAKIFHAIIHRYTENVYGICTGCFLFPKFFLANSFYLYGLPKFSPTIYFPCMI